VRLLDLRVPTCPTGAMAVEGDVTSVDTVRQLVQGGVGDSPLDVLVHLAGAGMSGAPMLDRELCQRVNVGGARTCVHCCTELAESGQQVSLVFLSTYNTVFHGQHVDMGNEDAPYSTDAQATDEYSRSKTEAERSVLAADGAAGGLLRTLAIRPAAIFGEQENRHLLRIARLMELGAFSVAFGDPNALQDWLYIDTLLDAIMGAASALGSSQPVGGRAFFVNDCSPVNTLALMEPLARALGCRTTPALRLPLYVMQLLAHACEIYHRWFRLPPLFTRAEVFKAAVHHTYSSERACAAFGFRPRQTSVQAMQGVALTIAKRHCSAKHPGKEA